MRRRDISRRNIGYRIRWMTVGLALVLLSSSMEAQVVIVSLTLETNRVATGQETVLRAMAHIDRARLKETDRILWWNVSLTNETPSIARIEHVRLQRHYSDKDSEGSGKAQGSNVVAEIYDTFVGFDHAGWSNAVELFVVPVTGLAAGNATFRLGPGSTNAVFKSDFLVASTDGSGPLIGGDYSNGRTVLSVVDPNAPVAPRPTLSIIKLPLMLDHFAGVRVTYSVSTNWNYWLDGRRDLTSSWLEIPGGPHNVGRFEDTNGALGRFYRVRVQSK